VSESLAQDMVDIHLGARLEEQKINQGEKGVLDQVDDPNVVSSSSESSSSESSDEENDETVDKSPFKTAKKAENSDKVELKQHLKNIKLL
jgi:hypothetical protein